MYSAPYTSPPPSDPASAIVSLLMAGSLIYIFLVVGSAILSTYITYRVIKAAVRNGTIEAINKTGLADRVGGAGFIHGYPEQPSYAAPAPPAAEYGGYRGPTG